MHKRTGRHSVLLLAGALAGTLAIVAGCGSATDTAGPAGSGGGSAGDGAAVYAARCASCHGGELQGTAKGPSHLSRVYEPSHHSDASFRRAITEGSPQHHWKFGAMPPVQGMSDADINAVIAYVRAQQQARGFKD